jgi:hypothetical protein
MVWGKPVMSCWSRQGDMYAGKHVYVSTCVLIYLDYVQLHNL